MGYAKTFNPDSYGELLPLLEKALKLGAGGKMSFKVKDGNSNTAGYLCRQFFHVNPHVTPREFIVRVGTQCAHLEDNIIEIEKRKGASFTIEEL